MLAPDHRGHGRGIRSRRPFRLEQCADDVAALIHATGAGRAIVVGYSMGGAIAQLVWRRHPEVLDGLVLSATAARFGYGPRTPLAGRPLGLGLSVAVGGVPRPLRQAGITRFIDRRTAGGEVPPWMLEEWKRADPVALMQAGLSIQAFDATSWTAAVDVPTSVVVTTEDRTVSPRLQRDLAETIPDACLFEVAGDHRACVDVARQYVPVLADACRCVAVRSRAGAGTGA